MSKIITKRAKWEYQPLMHTHAIYESLTLQFYQNVLNYNKWQQNVSYFLFTFIEQHA